MERIASEPRPPPRVLVLGGAGFIGRHVVAALAARAVKVIVGSRRPERIGRRLAAAVRAASPAAAGRSPSFESREARFERLPTPAHWTPLLVGVDLVVNCVGILRERGHETYDAVHHRAPAALAAACRTRGLPLVHVSALGLEGPARSGFLRSKQAGEAALRASGVAGAIVRPSLLDAEHGGYGAVWIRRAARLPWLPLPADATGRIAALDVRDLGEAMAILVHEVLAAADDRAASPGLREVELGGVDAVPLAEYIARLRRATGRPPARVLPLPGWFARLAAHVCDVLHVTPYSFGHWELLRRDTRPARADLAVLLGRAPRAVGRPAACTERPLPAAPRPAIDATR